MIEYLSKRGYKKGRKKFQDLVETLAFQDGVEDEQSMKALLNKVIEAQNRAIQETVCPVCQQSFSQEKVGRTGLYCSAACKQKAYRQRRNQ